MKRGYFGTAWRDVRTSPHWIRSLLLLALLAVVPVIGPLMVMGYAFGWSRDIAWAVRTPMPAHLRTALRSNLTCGLHVFVLCCVFIAAPVILTLLFEILFDGGLAHWASQWHLFAPVNVDAVIHVTVTVVCYLFALTVLPFILVGSMRTAIYGRLSAGFQIARLWSMIRYRFSGLLRIAGILGVLALAIVAVIAVYALLMGMISVLYSVGVMLTGGHVELSEILAGLVPLTLGSLPIPVYLVSVLTTFACVIIARALGYWTAQFDVPHWRGQDDPMPFEQHGVVAGAGGTVPPGGEQAGSGTGR